MSHFWINEEKKYGFYLVGFFPKGKMSRYMIMIYMMKKQKQRRRKNKMPNGDGTGPSGDGPNTGRGQGPCQKGINSLFILIVNNNGNI